ncbi:unnamed protein product [Urochloa humidicola]
MWRSTALKESSAAIQIQKNLMEKKNIPLKGKGPATGHGRPDAVSIPLSTQRTFELQSACTMGSTEFNMLDEGSAFTDEPILAMPPCQSNEKVLEAYEEVHIG